MLTMDWLRLTAGIGSRGGGEGGRWVLVELPPPGCARSPTPSRPRSSFAPDFQVTDMRGVQFEMSRVDVPATKPTNGLARTG